MEKIRSFYLAAFGVVFSLISLYNCLGLKQFTKAPFLTLPNNFIQSPILQQVVGILLLWVYPLANLFIIPFFVFVGIGIIRRKYWSYIAMIGYCYLQIGLAVASIGSIIIRRQFEIFEKISPQEVLWMVIFPFICLYIFKNVRVKEQFKKHGAITSI